MGLLAWLQRFVSGSQTPAALASRHARRDEARRRHHETGDPLWTDDDRHLGPEGERWVADVAPGLPGHYGSVHTTTDD